MHEATFTEHAVGRWGYSAAELAAMLQLLTSIRSLTHALQGVAQRLQQHAVRALHAQMRSFVQMSQSAMLSADTAPEASSLYSTLSCSPQTVHSNAL